MRTAGSREISGSNPDWSILIMKFKAKKRYGASKIVTCPFCGKRATQENEQGVEVCPQHTKSKLQEIRCICKSWLEQRQGKFGAYFNCINCGNINFSKAMEIKAMTKVIEDEVVEKKVEVKKEPKEITITSDDLEYFD